MGDMGGIFNAMRAHGQERRAANRDRGPELLREAGIAFTTHNYGAHLIVEHKGKPFVDYWPGTGKWIERRTQRHNRGVKSLLRRLAELAPPKPEESK